MSVKEPLMLPPDVATLLCKGIALLVGTADDQLFSTACRAWGPSWNRERGLLEVLLPLPAGARTVENLEARDAVSFSMTMPTDYAAFQLKGQCVEIRRPEAQDWRRARAHFDAFLAELPRVGLEPTVYATWFPAEGCILSVRLGSAYCQSPGAGAGMPL